MVRIVRKHLIRLAMPGAKAHSPLLRQPRDVSHAVEHDARPVGKLVQCRARGHAAEHEHGGHAALHAGDNVGVLLRGIQRDEIERGQVLAAPGSINPHTKFKGEVYILSKEEGGRHTPFVSNYRPQFYFRTTDVTGVITLPEGTDMVMPGDNVEMTVELIAPIAIENNTKFSIREGGRTVGSGNVIEILG